MTGKEKIVAALSAAGSVEIPAVTPYEGIFIRDHLQALLGADWWQYYTASVEVHAAWYGRVIRRLGQDWFHVLACPSRADRADVTVERAGESWVRRNRTTGEAQPLAPPPVGGLHATDVLAPPPPAATRAAVEARLPLEPAFDPQRYTADGRTDLARAQIGQLPDLYPIGYVGTPFWHCYGLWGFERMMTMLSDDPALVHLATSRFLHNARQRIREQAALGARGVWIEECMTDMLSPADFAEFNLPSLRELIAEIRACGMHSVYYYCGDPAGKWELLPDAGADALSLEEGKKGFAIDIAEVVRRADGRCAVLGNLDAIGVLQDGSDEQLQAEIARQLHLARDHGRRFIMSLGSPVTPLTPVTRVRRFCDLVRAL